LVVVAEPDGGGDVVNEVDDEIGLLGRPVVWDWDKGLHVLDLSLWVWCSEEMSAFGVVWWCCWAIV
jgi:hypothetical protein